MPEGLPPALWDTTTSTVKTDDAIKTLVDLNKFKTEHDARLAAVPEKPELYKIELPKDLEVPVGLELKFDDKHPVLGPALLEARAAAKELNLDQAGFNKLLAIEAKRTIAEFKAAAAEVAAEFTKLGDKGQARVAAAETFLKANLDEAHYEAIRPFVGKAKAFEAIEKLIAKATGSNIPGEDNRDPLPPPAQPTTIEQRWFGQKKG